MAWGAPIMLPIGIIIGAIMGAPIMLIGAIIDIGAIMGAPIMPIGAIIDIGAIIIMGFIMDMGFIMAAGFIAVVPNCAWAPPDASNRARVRVRACMGYSCEAGGRQRGDCPPGNCGAGRTRS